MADDTLLLTVQGKDANATQVIKALADSVAGSGSAADNAKSSFQSFADVLEKFGEVATIVGAGIGVFEFAKTIEEASDLALKFNNLGAVLDTLGKNTGYTQAQMLATADAVQEVNVSAVEARQVVARLSEAHIDLAKASDLTRVAQDAATISGGTATSMMERLILAIQTGSPFMLRHIGLTADFATAQKTLATSLGKTTDQLTQQEKIQANMNAVLQAGVGIAGTYESTIHLQQQISEGIENSLTQIGQAFNPAAITLMSSTLKVVQSVEEELKKLSDDGTIDRVGQAFNFLAANVGPLVTAIGSGLAVKALLPYATNAAIAVAETAAFASEAGVAAAATYVFGGALDSGSKLLKTFFTAIGGWTTVAFAAVGALVFALTYKSSAEKEADNYVAAVQRETSALNEQKDSLTALTEAEKARQQLRIQNQLSDALGAQQNLRNRLTSSGTGVVGIGTALTGEGASFGSALSFNDQVAVLKQQLAQSKITVDDFDKAILNLSKDFPQYGDQIRQLDELARAFEKTQDKVNSLNSSLSDTGARLKQPDFNALQSTLTTTLAKLGLSLGPNGEVVTRAQAERQSLQGGISSTLNSINSDIDRFSAAIADPATTDKQRAAYQATLSELLAIKKQYVDNSDVLSQKIIDATKNESEKSAEAIQKELAVYGLLGQAARDRLKFQQQAEQQAKNSGLVQGTAAFNASVQQALAGYDQVQNAKVNDINVALDQSIERQTKLAAATLQGQDAVDALNIAFKAEDEALKQGGLSSDAYRAKLLAEQDAKNKVKAASLQLATTIDQENKARLAAVAGMGDGYTRAVDTINKISEAEAKYGVNSVEASNARKRAAQDEETARTQIANEYINQTNQQIAKNNALVAATNAATDAQIQYGKSSEVAADAIAAANRQIFIEEESAKLGPNNQDKLKAIIASYDQLQESIKKLTLAQQDQNLVAQYSATVDQDLIDKLDVLAQKYPQLAQAIDQAELDMKIKSLSASDSWVDQAKAGLLTYQKTAENSAQIVSQTVQDGFKGMEDALVKFVQTGKLSWTDMVNSMIADIVRLQIRASESQILQGLFGGNGGGGLFGGGGGGGLFNIDFGAFLDNLGYTGSGSGFSPGDFLPISPVSPFAKGAAFSNGIVDTPTLFRFANGAAIGEVGEAGPEAIVPLRRGADGSLGVASNGGGVSVEIYDQRSGSATPAQVQDGGRKNDGRKVLRIMLKEEMKRSLTAGDYDATMKHAFGVSRRAITR